MSRKSSRGNPWHDARGRFCSGPRAKSTSERTQKEYDERTAQRFGREASDNQVAFAKKIEKQLGVPVPENGTAREYEEYIKENIHDYNSASEGQARTIRHLEEEHGITLGSDDRYGGNAGGFIGSCKKASALLDENNWEKHDDGCYYCIVRQYNDDGSMKLKKDGTPYGEDTGYRMVPVKVNGKTRYQVERGDSRYKTGADGKKHRIRTYHKIDDPRHGDGTGLKSMVKDARSDAMKRASMNELKRYTNTDKRQATKRSPKGVQKTVDNFNKMGDADNWNRNGDKLSFGSSYDENNSYNYVIEPGTTGLHVYRDVTSVQTASYYNKDTGRMETRKTTHQRREWVGTGIQSESEALEVAKKHEGNSIMKRIDLKGATPAQIDKWKAKGWITSKTQYSHMLDDVKAYIK